jgi:hypothetical protein
MRENQPLRHDRTFSCREPEPQLADRRFFFITLADRLACRTTNMRMTFECEEYVISALWIPQGEGMYPEGPALPKRPAKSFRRNNKANTNSDR